MIRKATIFRALVVMVLVVPLMLSLLAISTASAQADLSIWEHNDAAATGNSSVYQNNIAAQIFTPTEPHDISYVSVAISVVKEEGGDPGYARLGIRQVDDSYNPSGGWLAYIDIDGDAVGNETTWYTLQLNTRLNVDDSRSYALQLQATSNSNSVNYFNWAYSGNESAGNMTVSVNGGTTWTPDANKDMLFMLWGETNLEIYSAEVYTGYQEEGDWLITIHYFNEASQYYLVPGLIERYFRLQLVDTTVGNDTCGNGTVIAESVPRHWGMAVGSIYISTADAHHLEWGGNYSVRIQSTYGSAQYACLELTDGCWRGQNLNELDSWCLSVAEQMENYSGQTYIVEVAEKGKVLNEAAQAIFCTGIPGLDSERNNLFQVPTDGYAPGEEEYDPALQGSIDLEVMVGPRIYGDMETFTGDVASTGFGPEQLALVVAAIIFLVVGGYTVHPAVGIAGLAIAIPIGVVSMHIGAIAVVYVALAISVSAVLLVWHLVPRQT